jgi:hypothetical protein
MPLSLVSATRNEDMTMSNLMPIRDDDILDDQLAKFFPQHAREAYQRLVEIDTARDGLYASNQAKIHTEREKLREMQGDLNWGERQIRDGARHTAEDEAAIAKTKTKIAKQRRKIEEMTEKNKLPACLPLEPITNFVLAARRPLKDGRVTVKLRSGESPAAALEASRANRDALIAKKNETQRTLLPLDRALARIVADVEQLAARGRPKFEPTTKLVRHDSGFTDEMVWRQGELELPTEPIDTGVRTLEIGDGLAFTTWLLKDQIVARARTELTVLYKGKSALSLEERESRIAEIDAAILNEEFREEFLVQACEANGLTVYRRPLANPAVVLGVAPTTV